MYFCKPAKRISLNFTSVLGKRRKNPQAPANLRCEINCKKREVKQRNRSFKIACFGIRTQKDSWLVCSFCRSARTMIGYGNSTLGAGNLSTCQVTHSEFLWLDWV